MVLDEKRMEPSACHFYHFVITEYDRRGQMKKSMYLSEGKNISAFLCNRKVPITQKALRAKRTCPLCFRSRAAPLPS